MSAVIDSLQTRAAQLGIFKGTAGCLELGALDHELLFKYLQKGSPWKIHRNLALCPVRHLAYFLSPIMFAFPNPLSFG